MLSLNGSFDGYNDGNLEGLLLKKFLVSTGVKVLGYDEGIKLEFSHGVELFNIPLNVYGIKIRIGIGTDMGSLDESFDGSNDGKREDLFLGCSLLMLKCLALMNP